MRNEYATSRLEAQLRRPGGTQGDALWLSGGTALVKSGKSQRPA